MRNADDVVERIQVTHDDVWFNPLPMFHAGGSIFNTLGALASEASVVQMVSFDPELALRLIEEERPTVTSCVPTMYAAMIEHPHFASTNVDSLKKTCTGGSTVRPEIVREIEERFSVNFLMTYGQTEAGPTVALSLVDDSFHDKSTSIGIPLPSFGVKVVDPRTGGTIPVGQPGELRLSGETLMIGYFNNPEETHLAIDADGWLRTGDLCSLDSRGYLHHHGRLKEVIIRGGENISPVEVETVLTAHPSVVDAVVVGVPDEKYGEQVVAFVRLLPDQSLNSTQPLVDYVGERLARYKVPKRIWIVEAFPMTPSGKIKKSELITKHSKLESALHNPRRTDSNLT